MTRTLRQRNALNDEALEVVGDAAYEADPQ